MSGYEWQNKQPTQRIGEGMSHHYDGIDGTNANTNRNPEGDYIPPKNLAAQRELAARYTNNEVRGPERDAEGNCAVCGERDKHLLTCATLARRLNIANGRLIGIVHHLGDIKEIPDDISGLHDGTMARVNGITYILDLSSGMWKKALLPEMTIDAREIINSKNLALDSTVLGAADPNAKGTGANARQVGGQHYGLSNLQHWDLVRIFGWDYFQGQIIKYVMRWNKKNGTEDLEKAQHYLEKYIEIEKAKTALDPHDTDSPSRIG